MSLAHITQIEWRRGGQNIVGALGEDATPQLREAISAYARDGNAAVVNQTIVSLFGQPCGFYEFKHDDELQAIWEEYGNADAMFWRPGMGLPITHEDLEDREYHWLNSGEGDTYGINSFFIYRYYDDDKKQELWDSFGDKSLYRWESGMRRPVAI